MRITHSMYYKDIQSRSFNMNEQMFDVNKQISSGLKIQYAHDDVGIFVETMRLDNELTTLGQVKQSTENGFKMSNQADTVLGEFSDSMNRMKTLFIQAANDTNDDTSRDAIASELRGLESNLKSLANTSINGEFIFSGSATNIKPIRESDGRYMGNDIPLSATIGSGVQQQYNITGAELFLGEDLIRNREITTNVSERLNNPDDGSTMLEGSTTMKNFMGDSPSGEHYFYLRGTKHNGETFNEKIVLTNDNTMDDLLNKIGEAYGNTGSLKVVDVELSADGQIIVQDKMSGSSKLDFHLVGATDFNDDATDHADVSHIDDLSSGVTDYDDAKDNGKLYIREFLKSGLDNADGVSGVEGNIYDRVKFSQDGTKVTGSVPQIVKYSHEATDDSGRVIETIKEDERNSFAKPSTLLSEVFDVSHNNGSLDGTTLKLTGKDINGNDYDVDIDLKSSSNGGSTFTINGDTYSIFDMGDTRSAVDADEMTYQQLLDVVNMVVSDTLPSSDTAEEYDKAIKNSNFKSNTYLTYDGKIEFDDLTATSQTQASIALYDSNSGDFTKNTVASFNANNALTIRDPKTDFFKTIDEMIKSVEEHKTYPDATSGTPRNIGIENSIGMLDDLMDHVSRSNAKVGAQSNSLEQSLERTQTLEISTMTLRSSVVDTDLAEASLDLTQLMNNYEAMLSTVGKISKLSLVNYL